MISEPELQALSYPDMPLLVGNSMPGPKSQDMLDRAHRFQSPTRPSVKGALVIEEARGAGIKDRDGNILIDLSGGVAVAGVGRNHPKVIAAIENQCRKLMHSAGLVNETTVALAEKLSALMPEGLRDECFTWFGMSGSGAVETAIKFARAISGRSQIVAFEGAYHGVFHGSLALTTRTSFRTGFRPFVPGEMHMPYAYCYRCFVGQEYPGCGTSCARYFDYKLSTPNTGADDVAAVIIESMQADGGYIDPPIEFMQQLRETCTRNGILLIIDEIQAGAGRTGKMWAIEHYGIVPDMLIWAKAVGGDLPLSGVTLHNRYKDRLPPASQVITGAENALANAVALVNLELLSDPEADLIGRSVTLGREIKAKFEAEAITNRIIGDVRGRGFFIGIELVADRPTRAPLPGASMGRILKTCEMHGVRIMACGRHGSTIRLMPSLTITRAHFHAACDILIDALRQEAASLPQALPA
jgi:4-aminobutyrate aminotransferase